MSHLTDSLNRTVARLEHVEAKQEQLAVATMESQLLTANQQQYIESLTDLVESDGKGRKSRGWWRRQQTNYLTVVNGFWNDAPMWQ